MMLPYLNSPFQRSRFQSRLFVSPFACFGPFSDASSSATETNVNPTDQAQANFKSNVAQAQSRQVVGKGRIAEQGSIQLGDKAKLQLGGVNLEGLKKFKGDLTINTGDGGAGTAAIADLSGKIADLAGRGVSAGADQSAGIAETVREAFSQLAGLVESKNTGGESTASKNFVWIVVAAGAAVALAIWAWRQKG